MHRFVWTPTPWKLPDSLGSSGPLMWLCITLNLWRFGWEMPQTTFISPCLGNTHPLEFEIWEVSCTLTLTGDTALLEIDFMTNEICLEGSSSPSGLIYGLWHVLQGESGGCPWGLMPWLHLCSEVSSNFWSPWSPLTFICAGKEMQEKRTANRKQWNLEYLQWEGVLSDTMEHCAFAVGLTANLCNSKMLSLHS